MEVWIHPATFTLGVVTGDFIEFKWNGRMEESYFPFIRKYWRKVGRL